MKMSNLSAIAALVSAGSVAFGGNPVLDWASLGWANQAPGGGYQTGASMNSISIGAIDVDVTFELFGTATGQHNSLFGGGVTTGPGLTNFQNNADEFLFGIGDSGDLNTEVFENYSLLTINFSSPVDITNLVIGDIDIHPNGSWQDAVRVVGSMAGDARNTTYNPEESAFFELRTFTFDNIEFDALVGINGDNPFGNTAAETSVSFDGLVDRIELFYFNGPDTSANFRGIYLSNIGFVPAPGSAALIGLSGLLLARRKRA